MENPAAKCSVLKVVRSPRVELGWVAPLVPKTSASANSATTAIVL